MSAHVTVEVFPWLRLELPAEVVAGLTDSELEECAAAARHEAVRCLRERGRL